MRATKALSMGAVSLRKEIWDAPPPVANFVHVAFKRRVSGGTNGVDKSNMRARTVDRVQLPSVADYTHDMSYEQKGGQKG